MMSVRAARLVLLSLTLVLGATLWVAIPAVADSFSAWTPGPDGVLDNTYIGFIDVPAAGATVPTGSFSVSGWFVDTTAQGWAGADNVQVWLGTIDGGGTLLSTGSIDQSRPDVAAATGNPFWASSGFTASVPSGALSQGSQVLSAYVHTPGKGWWYRQVQVNVSAAPPAASVPAPSSSVSGTYPLVGIEAPKEGEQVGTKNDYTLIGYALDINAMPGQGVGDSGVDRVQVYLDKDRDSGGIYLGDADLGDSDSVAPAKYGGQFASSGWRLTFKPTRYKAKGYTLFAYARSVVTGREDVATRYFAIKET
jgi:hypothetical protein